MKLSKTGLACVFAGAAMALPGFATLTAQVDRFIDVASGASSSSTALKCASHITTIQQSDRPVVSTGVIDLTCR